MSLLEQITPAILTFNEEPNIRRALESLDWAPQVIVVDSGSTDATLEIARSFPRVRTWVRPFDGYGNQWRYALGETGIRTRFVLALDADMSVDERLQEELAALPDEVPWSGAFLPFDYRIHGRSLGRSLLAPQLRLVRVDAARAGQRGHAHIIECAGPTINLTTPLIHDDRKPLEDFVRAQCNYSLQEWGRLSSAEAERLVDRVRRRAGLPGTVALCAYAALRIGLWAPSPARRRYWIERAIFELLLAYRREEHTLRR